MVVLLIPNLDCPFRCVYCFEKKRHMQTDVEAMKRRLASLELPKGVHVCLHGGEATLADVYVFEELVREAKKYTSNVSLQTCGYWITEQVLDVIKRYDVSVGVSIDGPPEQNILRGERPLDKKYAKQMTDRIMQNLHRLCDEGVRTSIIAVLHRENVGTEKRLVRFEKWLLELKDIGVNSGRLNPMFATRQEAKPYELTSHQVASAWIALYEFAKLHELRYDPFREMANNLQGKPVSPCSFSGCDTFATPTVSILPDGSLGLCDRTFGRGLWTRSEQQSHCGRTEALKLTQCRGCRYFEVCHGGCPMEGFENDWRNKTRFCLAIYNMYSWIEKDLRALGVEVRWSR